VALTAVFVDRPQTVIELAGDLLSSEPVVNNLILSLLADRVAYPQPGRYWVATDDRGPVGVVFQSPLDFPAAVTPMPVDAVDTVVAAIGAAGVTLPGVAGEAATVARFAGQLTELTGTGAEPFNGQRIYELEGVPALGKAAGHLRRAEAADCQLILDWMHGFNEETGERRLLEEILARRVAAGQFWLWQDGDACSVAAHTVPVAGVTRIQAVYTPPALRGRGYAGACVSALSARLHDAGHRSILYTDLANPISNRLYRRIGYRARVECLRYRFG
jgi:predicted GNAT family acetyltransferase